MGDFVARMSRLSAYISTTILRTLKMRSILRKACSTNYYLILTHRYLRKSRLSTMNGSNLTRLYFLEVLASCSQQFSTVYTIFDAVDESKEAYHSELLDLFVHLQNLRYKIVISGRPGSPLNKIQSKLDCKVIEIRANANDLESYMYARVQQGLVRKLCVKLIPNVDGMYVEIFLHELTLGSSC